MTDTLAPVILLHGWGGTFTSTFGATGWVDALNGEGRVTPSINLPGHGPASSCDPNAYVDLASLLFDRLPEGALDIVGFSLGAKLALAMAARRPERFRRIVIAGVGDNIFAPEPAGEQLAEELERPTAAPPAPIAALARYARESGNDPLALAAVLRRQPNPVLREDDFGAIGAVLLVNSEADAIAQPDARLRGALRDPAYFALDGVQHLALPADVKFRAAALAFLSARSANDVQFSEATA